MNRAIRLFALVVLVASTARAQTPSPLLVDVGWLAQYVNDRSLVLLQGPDLPDGGETVMAVRSPACLEAAWRYWNAVRERVLPDAHLRALAWKPRNRPLAPHDRLMGQRDTLRRRRGAELGASPDRAGPPRDNDREAALPACGRSERLPRPAGSRQSRCWRA